MTTTAKQEAEAVEILDHSMTGITSLGCVVPDVLRESAKLASRAPLKSAMEASS